MNNVITYGFNGLVRTTIGGTGVIAIGLGGKIIFEQMSINIKTDSTLSTSEQYEDTGILTQQLLNYFCNIESATTSMTAEQEVCVQKELQHLIDTPILPIVAPVIAAAFLLTQAIPKGLAYCQLAFNEIAKKDEKVLTEKDFKRSPKTPSLKQP